MSCSSSDSSLLSCTNRGIGIHNCGHNEDVALICCESAPKSKCGDSINVGVELFLLVFKMALCRTFSDSEFPFNGQEGFCPSIIERCPYNTWLSATQGVCLKCKYSVSEVPLYYYDFSLHCVILTPSRQTCVLLLLWTLTNPIQTLANPNFQIRGAFVRCIK